MGEFQKSLIRFMYVALVVLGVFAVWGMLRTNSPEITQEGFSRGMQGVTSTGTCVVRTKPELVEVTLGVSQSASTARGAKDYVKSTCRKIIGVLTAGGVSKKDIQTQQFHLASHWDSGPGWEAKKWNAEEMLRVRIKDLDKVAELIDSAVKAGANRIGSLEYSVENVNEIRAQGRAKAAEVARKKAEELAAALGGKLGSLVACNEGYPTNYSSYSSYYGYSRMDKSAQANISMSDGSVDTSASEEITIQPGEMVTTVVVTATYAVE